MRSFPAILLLALLFGFGACESRKRQTADSSASAEGRAVDTTAVIDSARAADTTVTTDSAQTRKRGLTKSVLPHIQNGEIVYPPAFRVAVDSLDDGISLPESTDTFFPHYPYHDSTRLLATGDFNGDGTRDVAVQSRQFERIVLAHGSPAERFSKVYILEAAHFFPGLGVTRQRRLQVTGMYDDRSEAEVHTSYPGFEFESQQITGVGGKPDTLWYVRLPEEADLIYGSVGGSGTPHFLWNGERYVLVGLPHA